MPPNLRPPQSPAAREEEAAAAEESWHVRHREGDEEQKRRGVGGDGQGAVVRLRWSSGELAGDGVEGVMAAVAARRRRGRGVAETQAATGCFFVTKKGRVVLVGSTMLMWH